jgi:hypothetical protein
MSITIQTYLSESTKKAASELEAAYLNIPEDKRAWSPEGKGRSANDQLAECAMLGLRTAETLRNKSFGNLDFAEYFQNKAELASKPELLLPMLQTNVGVLVSTIASVADDDMAVSVDAPWGPMTLSEIIVYPYWNMSYHLGQINYIASLLDCLK